MSGDAEDVGEPIHTDEPVVVEWTGGLGNEQRVEVNPYSGTVTVNGREFEIGALSSDDVPDWMHRNAPLSAIEGEQ